MSDDDRHKLEAALVASLILIYQGRARDAMTHLAVVGATLGVPLDVRDRVESFARQRAQLVQDGINTRLDKADDVDQAKAEIAQYNRTVLMPFLASWASQTALSDVYDSSRMPDGQTAKEAHQWVWTQVTGHPDDCMAAAEASPSSYDDLVSIAGGPPPSHAHCQCTLTPNN